MNAAGFVIVLKLLEEFEKELINVLSKLIIDKNF